MMQTMLDKHYPAKPKGHRRVDLRRVLNGILLRLRTGCQWNQWPKQCGDDRTGHRHVQPWCQQGLFERIWAVLVEDCHEWGGVAWLWQAADAMRGKARMVGDRVGRNPLTAANRGETAPGGGRDGRASGRHARWGPCPRHHAADGDPGS
jgi:transposase